MTVTGTGPTRQVASGRHDRARGAYLEARGRLPDREAMDHVSDRSLAARIALGLAVLERLEGQWDACVEQALEAEALARAFGGSDRELELVAESLPVAEGPRYERRPLAARVRGDLAWVRWNAGEREAGLSELRAALEELADHPAAGQELPAPFAGLLRRAEAGTR